ncbi:MAG: S8 family serine peptidase [Lysobacterales bacterium]
MLPVLSGTHRFDRQQPRPGPRTACDQQLLGLPHLRGLHRSGRDAHAGGERSRRRHLVVVSAGNSGSSCSSVNTPAAIYEASFTVGNSTFSDTMAGSSSRGPVTVDGSNRIKPDVTAPGTGIRSSVRGGGYQSFSGTSMSGPHVAGAAALLMSVDETLKRDPDRVIDLLQQTAVSINSTQTCGGIPTTTIPNPVFGHGRIDVAAAYALLTQGTMFDDGFEDAAPTADH